ncbi:MAG: hypothetical protein E7642_05315 [Ruminococcaceae bacterium]|nr:hypothetical protein [Oscillospiraceae bacterium]
MRLDKLNLRVLSRLLSLILCFAFALSAVALTACNVEEEAAEGNTDAGSEEATQEATEESATEFPLNEDGLVNVLVFTTDVAKGGRLTTKNTKLIALPATNLPRNIVTDMNDIKGLYYANKDFYAGDYVIKSRLTKTKPVVVDENTITETIAKTDSEFVVVTDFIKANTGEDLSGNLQMLIDKNPGRTLFFPDGEYVISCSLKTTSKPSESTSFYFSSGAILKASDDWDNDGQKRALICLGAKEKVNDIRNPGTNFYVMGGTFDGNGRADGISIDAGRETLIKDVTIINTRYGIHIKEGTNNVSSDSDIDDVTIVGNGAPASVGIYVVGYDNTISNARISNVSTGINSHGGTFVNNCTVENTAGLPNTIAFQSSGEAWLSNCVSINCDVGFTGAGARGFIKQCMAKWTVNFENSVEHTAFKSGGKLYAAIVGCRAEFLPEARAKSYFLRAGKGGPGRVVSPIFDATLVSTADATAGYLETGSIIIAPAPASNKEN